MRGQSSGLQAPVVTASSTAGQFLLVGIVVWVGLSDSAKFDRLLHSSAVFGMVVLTAASTLAGTVPSLLSLALAIVGILLAFAQGYSPILGSVAFAALLAAWGAGLAFRWRREQEVRALEDQAAAKVAAASDREEENGAFLLRIQALEAAIARMPAFEDLAVRLVALTKDTEVAEAILDATLVLCPHASVARVFAAEGTTLRLLAVRGRTPLPETERETWARADSIDLAVLEKRDSVLVTNAPPAEGRSEGRSIACTPLLEEEERFGGARVSTCRGLLRIQSGVPGALSRDDLENLNILASLAAMSLQNTRLLQRVEDLVIFDALTGLYTMRYFRERFQEEASRTGRSGNALGLLLFDLDDFKKVNDTQGHLAGDEALVRFAGLLQAWLRNGYVAARYGGDEFALLLPERHRGFLREAAEEIRARAEGLAGGSRVTTSVGVSLLSPVPEQPEPLIRLADEALYRAKRSGKNRVEVAGGEAP